MQASLDHLHAQARSAYQDYQATRYDAAGRVLPGLIRGAETAARAARGAETAARAARSASPAAYAVRARVYDTTAALLSRVGEPFLAWAAADRAMSAAEQSGDPLLAAASNWRLSYMITGRKHPQEALDLAMTAVATLDRAMPAPSLERLGVLGALHLAAATAAAAAFDRATTTAWLASARRIADRTGEANHMGTAFGPVNVAIHAISASLKLGDPRTATETGEALDLAALPIGLVGRRTQVNLDLARAYAMTRKDAAAVNLLLAAERLSPQLVQAGDPVAVTEERDQGVDVVGPGAGAVVGDGVVAHRVVAVRVEAGGERAGPAAGSAASRGAHVGGDQGGDGREHRCVHESEGSFAFGVTAAGRRTGAARQPLNAR